MAKKSAGATNKTKNNIIRKRKMRQRQRRIVLFRLTFVLIVFGAILTATIYIGYSLFNFVVGMYDEYNKIYQDYTTRQETIRGPIDPRFDSYTNVLVLGLDAGANKDGDSDQRADTIMLMSMENTSGRLRLITIPPDTWLERRGSPAGKASSLYAIGGAPLLVREISALLGISIHQYITLDMQTFAELIDILGGVDIYVESDMDYDDPAANLSIHLKKGYQTLDGDLAQKYLRYRGSDLGDVGRVQRQQRFVKALYAKILQLETIPKLPAIADVFQHRMTTSAEIFDSAHLANVLRSISSEPPIGIMLPGEEDPAGTGIWLPNREAIDMRIAELFPASEITNTSEE